jgi:hypothetical protein
MPMSFFSNAQRNTRMHYQGKARGKRFLIIRQQILPIKR